MEQALERLRTAGRNDDCPCGSGKKYKKCHLRADEEAASKALAEANAAKAAAAAAEAEEHAGHDHGPGEHPRAQPSAGPAGAPKTPLSHKPMNTPRKAV